jgi:hypothetical protein
MAIKKKNFEKAESYNVLIDKDQLVKAKAAVNLPEAFRELVSKITKTNICPCCGSTLKRGK